MPKVKNVQLQYFYHQRKCSAKNPTDDNCICWHDEGTGIYANVRHDVESTFVDWRAQPIAKKVMSAPK